MDSLRDAVTSGSLDGQDDFAENPSGLKPVMRLCRLFEWQYLLNERAYLALCGEAHNLV